MSIIDCRRCVDLLLIVDAAWTVIGWARCWVPIIDCRRCVDLLLIVGVCANLCMGFNFLFLYSIIKVEKNYGVRRWYIVEIERNESRKLYRIPQYI